MCGEYGPQRTNFWATSGPQISQNSGLWSFSKKTFPLVAHQSSCACQFGLLLELCWILAPEAQFPGHFGRQIDHNSGLFIKYFPMDSHHSRFTCLFGVLLCIFQLCAPNHSYYTAFEVENVRTVNYILASSHHDRMRGAMLFCPGVTFCSPKQSLKLY